MKLARGLERIFGLAVAATMGTGLYWTVRIELSDWVYLKWNAKTIRRAVALAPGNPEYYRGWAEIEPEGAVAALEKAVELSPGNSILWIALGEAAEEKGDYRLGEASLIHAMELDNNFAPRWVLSDFYFHRGDAEKFWPVVRAALAVSYDDVSGLFRNCWSLSQDAPAILRRAIPDRQDVLRQYLQFLLREKRMPAAAPVAERVLARAGAKDSEALLYYCDSLLEAGQGGPALAVWNELNARKLLPYGRLAAETGRSLTNGDFAAPNFNAGFDWR